jgi:N-methylhydantoinase B
MAVRPDSATLDPVAMAVIQSRLERVVREMINTLLRSARAGVLGIARDFSCCLLTADDELLAWAESIPIHVMSGPDLMSRWMKTFHPDLRRGDAFLHNSPYHGNSHAADWSILIPVIDDDGIHRFTVLAKAHQGDCGNAEPTTYSYNARDVYEEGALIFPCVRAQTDYEDNQDLIRMCRMRIRVPDQWWGDYLAVMGAARIGERRLLGLVRELGAERLQAYSRQWFDHSEQRMIEAIQALPAARLTATTCHDPLPTVPEGVPIKVTVDIDPVDARISVDLTDNPDCLPAGINHSEACARTAAMIGVFNSIGRDVPSNAGSFRRLDILLRENCCVGIPRHPASCSAATIDLTARVVGPVQRCFAALQDGVGMADFAFAAPPAGAVISGRDPRNDEPFVNQLCLAVTGGAGGPDADGWLTAYDAGAAGMLYKDSVEMDEIKHPIRVLEQRLLPDTAGDGRFRGAPGARVRFQATGTPITVMTNSDGTVHSSEGARGGHGGAGSAQWVQQADGSRVELPGFHRHVLEPGDVMVSHAGGGGGYGPPHERPAERVRHDALEGWITRERAAGVYGVVLDDDDCVDLAATAARRAALLATPARPTDVAVVLPA